MPCWTASRNRPCARSLQAELFLDDRDNQHRMRGSGLLLVNPPWPWGEQFGQMMTEALAVWALDAQHRVSWLIPE